MIFAKSEVLKLSTLLRKVKYMTRNEILETTLNLDGKVRFECSKLFAVALFRGDR